MPNTLWDCMSFIFSWILSLRASLNLCLSSPSLPAVLSGDVRKKGLILQMINFWTFKSLTYHRSDPSLDLIHPRIAKIVVLTKEAHPASNQI